MNHADTSIRISLGTIRTTLKEPITSLEKLLDLLLAPLDLMGLLDDQPELRSRHGWKLGEGEDVEGSNLSALQRHIPAVQALLLEKVAVDWVDVLKAKNLWQTTVLRWFIPPSIGNKEIAGSALRTLSAHFSSASKEAHAASLRVALDIAAHFVNEISLGQLLGGCLADGDGARQEARQHSDWRISLNAYFGLAGKMANATAKCRTHRGDDLTIPESLGWTEIAAAGSAQMPEIVALLHQSGPPARGAAFLRTFLEKLIHIGAFPISVSKNSNHLGSSFLLLNWTTLLRWVAGSEHQHLQMLRLAFQSLGPHDMRAFAGALLARIQVTLLADLEYDTSELSSAAEEAGARVLRSVLGDLDPTAENDLWPVVIQDIVLARPGWTVGTARTLARWASSSGGEACQHLASAALVSLGQPSQVSHGPLAHHTFLVVLLILSVSKISSRKMVAELESSEAFLQGVNQWLGSTRQSVRLLGMLVAEAITNRGVEAGETGLQFPAETWDEPSDSKDLIGNVRKLEVDWCKTQSTDDAVNALLLAAQPPASLSKPTIPTSFVTKQPSTVSPRPKEPIQPKIQMLDSDDEFEDDELRPYSTQGPVDDVSVPTIDELDKGEIGVYAIRKKPPRPPIYIQEIAEYLRDSDNVERLEVGLTTAASLIRRKKGWGSELDENAVDLAFALFSLQDNFDLEGFEERRQAALIALVAASPKKAAPCIIEQFFTTHYSIAQRVAMLNALALGSRELAGLETPTSTELTRSSAKVAANSPFPTKVLPPALHQQLMRLELAEPEDSLHRVSAGLVSSALSSAKDDAEETIPEAARENRLTVNSRVNGSLLKKRTQPTERTSAVNQYLTLGADYFVMPLINQMWMYLRDVATSGTGGGQGGQYRGAGWAALLEPVLLSRFVQTLSVTLFSARLAPSFQSILVPEALALVITMKASGASADTAAESTTQSALLELVLVVLDASISLDRGKNLTRGQDGLRMLLEIKEWAEVVFEVEEGKGGVMGKSGRAAAGLLIRIEQIVDSGGAYRKPLIALSRGCD